MPRLVFPSAFELKTLCLNRAFPTSHLAELDIGAFGDLLQVGFVFGLPATANRTTLS
jgi:hypothetical protein